MISRRSLWASILCFAAAGLLLTMCGCSKYEWPTAAPSGDPREEHVLSETTRFAAMLKVDVVGRITDKAYLVDPLSPRYPGEKVPAAGWYQDGVAYYYRPVILSRDFEYGTLLAAHETCHAITRSEDGANECARKLVG